MDADSAVIPQLIFLSGFSWAQQREAAAEKETNDAKANRRESNLDTNFSDDFSNAYCLLPDAYFCS